MDCMGHTIGKESSDWKLKLDWFFHFWVNRFDMFCCFNYKIFRTLTKYKIDEIIYGYDSRKFWLVKLTDKASNLPDTPVQWDTYFKTLLLGNINSG